MVEEGPGRETQGRSTSLLLTAPEAASAVHMGFLQDHSRQPGPHSPVGQTVKPCDVHVSASVHICGQGSRGVGQQCRKWDSRGDAGLGLSAEIKVQGRPPQAVLRKRPGTPSGCPETRHTPKS